MTRISRRDGQIWNGRGARRSANRDLIAEARVLADVPGESLLWSDVADQVRAGLQNLHRFVLGRRAQTLR